MIRSSWNLAITLVVAVALVALFGCAPSQEATEDMAAEEGMDATGSAVDSPSLVGTYRLVSRELSDGSMIEPPQLEGMLTYTENYRNFNIVWKDTEGNRTSISYVAEYDLTEQEYSETSIYFMVNDESGTLVEGGGTSYDFSRPSASSPVTMDEGGSLTFDLPLHDEPTVNFTADGFTATAAGPMGEFVDVWERVE